MSATIFCFVLFLFLSRTNNTSNYINPPRDPHAARDIWELFKILILFFSSKYMIQYIMYILTQWYLLYIIPITRYWILVHWCRYMYKSDWFRTKLQWPILLLQKKKELQWPSKKLSRFPWCPPQSTWLGQGLLFCWVFVYCVEIMHKGEGKVLKGIGWCPD